MWASLSVLLLVGVISVSSKLPLPSFIKACDKRLPDFNECALKEAKNAIPHLVKGDRKYGIPKLAPLRINKIDMETPGNLVIHFTEVDVYGLDKVDVKKINIDPVLQKIDLDFKADYVKIEGNYDMDGKLLVLPIRGQGYFNITANVGDFQYKLNYTTITKNGDEYLQIADDSIDFTVDKFGVYFGNLFNGDPVLGPNTNKVLNDEWKSVLEELKPALEKTISSVASSIVNSIVEKVPGKLIFP
ncbi:hypothetical protein JTB14_021734 [Gonioctena quinquepunctata]|nr:hypothetical protein JTB14_021734 [Gonioctena quinquepunctata]